MSVWWQYMCMNLPLRLHMDIWTPFWRNVLKIHCRNLIFFRYVTGKSWLPLPRNFRNGLSRISWPPPSPSTVTYLLNGPLVEQGSRSHFQEKWDVTPKVINRKCPMCKIIFEVSYLKKCCKYHHFHNVVSPLYGINEVKKSIRKCDLEPCSTKFIIKQKEIKI